MIKYIEKHSRLFIVLSVMVASIVVIALAGMSYATGNSPIYTRDELSERINDLENETEFSTLVYDSNTSKTYNTETLLTDVVCWGSNNTTNISCSNSQITILKQGLYRVSAYGFLSFESTPSASYLTVTLNNQNWFSVPFETTSLGQSTNDFSTIVVFETNDTIRLKMLSLFPISVFRVAVMIEYVGQ